jgi:hypothetical protein
MTVRCGEHEASFQSVLAGATLEVSFGIFVHLRKKKGQFKSFWGILHND